MSKQDEKHIIYIIKELNVTYILGVSSFFNVPNLDGPILRASEQAFSDK